MAAPSHQRRKILFFIFSLYSLYINLNVVLSRTHLTTTKLDFIWKMLGGHTIEIERDSKRELVYDIKKGRGFSPIIFFHV